MRITKAYDHAETEELLDIVRDLRVLCENEMFHGLMKELQYAVSERKKKFMDVEKIKDLVRVQAEVNAYQSILDGVKSPVTAYLERMEGEPLFTHVPVSFDDENFIPLIGEEVPNEGEK